MMTQLHSRQYYTWYDDSHICARISCKTLAGNAYDDAWHTEEKVLEFFLYNQFEIWETLSNSKTESIFTVQWSHCKKVK
jgi:hypothetical protein